MIPQTRIVIKDDCWLWQGGTDSKGYARTQINGKKSPVHRIMYQLFVSQIKRGDEIDHLCRNRRCVNPNHLQAVSSTENKKLVGRRNNGKPDHLSC